MTLIRKLASVLLLASWLTSGSINSQELVPGQVYNTQNLTNNSTSASSTTGTWQNVGLWNQGLPCWAPGGAVYCGPKPYFNNGSVNFSYGTTDLNQVVNIAAALPTTSTGLRVNGFNFGFTAKNGNGWDNGQQDYLAAYVKFRDTSGAVVANYDYSGSTNRKYNWTTFNFSETFTTPYAASSLSTAQYGFVGRDTNGWAGPYGPEIQGINFSLKYSVDPCVKDPLSSPTCSGFLDALSKTTGATSTSTTSTTAASPATVAATTTTETPVTTTTTTVSGPPPAAVSADLLSKVVESNRTTNTASVASITAATNLNDKSSVAAFALSVIAKNAANDRAIQEKAAGDAIASANAAAAAVVEQAQAIALTQSLASANTANRLAGAAVASSGPAPGVNTAASVPAAGVNNAVTGPAPGANNASTSPAVVATVANNATFVVTNNTGPTQTGNNNINNMSAQSNLPLLAPAPAPVVENTAPTQSTAPVVQTAAVQNNNVSLPSTTPVIASFELLPPSTSTATQPVTSNPAQGLNVAITSTPFTPAPVFVSPAPVFVSPAPVIELPKFKEVESSRNIDMSSPTDFVAGYVNTKHNLNDMQATTNAPAVNSKAQDNDAAGGVTIATIAKMPPGYDLYTSLSIRDANFYKPEELYRGQKTVDNVRLLRGLTGASDRVHQEMVDSQYNK
jgi:hypothetical protein